MGMFDDIRCDAELPEIGPDPGTRCFQTKDRECLLDKYVITADGRLTLDGDRVSFHGMLHFHHYDSKNDTWWEWVAKFTDDALVEIKPVEIYTRTGTYPDFKYQYYFPAGKSVNE